MNQTDRPVDLMDPSSLPSIHLFALIEAISLEDLDFTCQSSIL